MKPIDKFYFEKDEPVRSCLLSLKLLITNYNDDFVSKWYYRLPCFMYRNQIFCYLWVDKKTQFPYIAIGKGVMIQHPDLIQGQRTFTKQFLVDPYKDIPRSKIYNIFDMAMKLYE